MKRKLGFEISRGTAAVYVKRDGKLVKVRRKQCWRWRLRGGNGKILADSAEAYTNFSDCVKCIRRVKQGAGSSTVEDLTMPNRFPPGYSD